MGGSALPVEDGFSGVSLRSNRPGRVLIIKMTFTKPLRPNMESTAKFTADGIGWVDGLAKLIQRPMERGETTAT